MPVLSRIAVGSALIIGSVVAFQVLRATRAEPNLSETAGQPPLVRTVEVRRFVTARPWTGYGTVRAMRAAEVGIQVAGRVVERPAGVEAGLSVDAGDLLIAIDPTDFARRVAALEGSLAALEAQIDQLDVEASSLDEQLTLVLEEAEIAQREYERALQVYEERGAGTQTEVDQRLAAYRRAQREATALEQQSRSIPPRRAALEANIATQQAELALAREDLARSRVVAPIAGVLQQVNLDEGDLAQVGVVAARVVDLSVLELPLALPASAADSLSIGDAVEVSLEARSSGRWEGTITRIAPEADAQTRSILVFAEIEQDLRLSEAGQLTPAQGPILRPGMFVVGRVVPSEPAAYLMVPRRAVVQGGVLVANLNSPARARRVEVDTLFAYEGALEGSAADEQQWFAVGSGLEEGQLVLVSNLDDLRDGSPIRTSEDADNDAASDGDGGAP